MAFAEMKKSGKKQVKPKECAAPIAHMGGKGKEKKNSGKKGKKMHESAY